MSKFRNLHHQRSQARRIPRVLIATRSFPQLKFSKACVAPDSLRSSHRNPVPASQAKSELFTKHMIRFRAINESVTQVADTPVEVTILNSHDGTSAYEHSLGDIRRAGS